MTLANIRYKDNTKIVLKAIKFPDVNWIYVVPDVAQWTLCKHGNGIYVATQRREYHGLRDLRFSQHWYWDATPCRVVKCYQRYEGPWCLIFSVQED